MTNLHRAGWVFPSPTARKCHFFRQGEIRSLCGRYARFADTVVAPDDGEPSPDDCAGCRKRFDKAKS